jgi:hypothetical protein
MSMLSTRWTFYGMKTKCRFNLTPPTGDIVIVGRGTSGDISTIQGQIPASRWRGPWQRELICRGTLTTEDAGEKWTTQRRLQKTCIFFPKAP